MMKSLLLTSIFLVCISTTSLSQSPVNLTLNVSVSFQDAPPGIVLNWANGTTATSVTVKRKLKQDPNWTSTFTLPGAAVAYTDTNIIPEKGYEYSIAINTNPAKTAYLYCGKDIPAVHGRGKLILLVDNAYITSLSSSIRQLTMDLIGDGWQVIRHTISRTDAVTAVKTLIRNEYLADTANVKALFLLGHIPVPYSGLLNPDGHGDHRGAWPADAYYADMTGTYTDVSVNDTSASSIRNRNKPGDGKFDQTLIPGKVVLQTGRVDLFNLPAINTNDTVLMQQYLQKDHAFRMKQLNPERRAIIDDNFGYFSGEAFASNGYRNFFALMGDTSTVKAGDYFTGMKSKSYLWSYGCGGGSYTNCSGVGNTANFAADTVQNIFTMLFGSYFGDWDSQNNLLRAPLASRGWTLANCWGGRPYWMFHHTGLGETIGFSAMTTQNNSFTYLTNYGGKNVHIALMGDPTLRIHVVAPVAALTVTPVHNNSHAQLNWTASADSVSGYYIYRASTVTDSFALITPLFVTATSFIDSFPHSGTQVYMVRAVKTEQVPTGSYFNLSQGIIDSTMLSTGISSANTIKSKALLFPNPFNTSSTLKLTTAGYYEQLQLHILDVLGREVRLLNLNYAAKDAGLAEVTIERDGLSSGMYFYEVTGNKENENKIIIAEGKLIVE